MYIRAVVTTRCYSHAFGDALCLLLADGSDAYYDTGRVLSARLTVAKDCRRRLDFAYFLLGILLGSRYYQVLFIYLLERGLEERQLVSVGYGSVVLGDDD